MWIFAPVWARTVWVRFFLASRSLKKLHDFVVSIWHVLQKLSPMTQFFFFAFFVQSRPTTQVAISLLKSFTFLINELWPSQNLNFFPNCSKGHQFLYFFFVIFNIWSIKIQVKMAQVYYCKCNFTPFNWVNLHS